MVAGARPGDLPSAGAGVVLEQPPEHGADALSLGGGLVENAVVQLLGNPRCHPGGVLAEGSVGSAYGVQR